ncbi:MAG: hypothetical protein FJ224_07040 [Lentisphaerae bacterium]|nr:hypothetical protein [Lentisphaerota bacterium]
MSWKCAVFAMTVAVFSAGCFEDDEGYRDHTPADGLGSIVVNNETYDEMDVFVDSEFAMEVGDWDDAAFDVEPGEHRVVLDGRDSDRSYAGDIDVLKGRLTILHVSSSPSSSSSYTVRIEYSD